MPVIKVKGVLAAELRVLAWRRDRKISAEQFIKAVDQLKRAVRKEVRAANKSTEKQS